jgi:uroporphyrinogen-III synthase
MTTAIITRPKSSIAQTTAVYNDAGVEVFKASCFAIKTSDSVQPQWLKMPADVWIILSVHALHHALRVAPDLAPTKDTQVIAVGPAVEKAWKKHFAHEITSHPLMNSEGVIELLKQLKPKSVKILTTGDGRDLIKRHCMQAHISYAQINTYQRIPLAIDQPGLLSLYENVKDNSVVLTATSSGILSYFMSQLSTELQTKILSQPIVVGAQRIAETADALGFDDIHLAASPSDEAMCEAVVGLG